MLIMGHIFFQHLNNQKANPYIVKLDDELLNNKSLKVASIILLFCVLLLIIGALASGAFSDVRGEGAYEDASNASIITRICFMAYHVISPIAAITVVGIFTLKRNLDRTTSRFAPAHLAQFDSWCWHAGQRTCVWRAQRIGIVKPIYKKAKIFIFNEATSALDTDTENAVLTSVYNLVRN